MKNARFRQSCSGTCFLNSGTEILIWSVRKQSENIIPKRRSQQEKAMDTVATCLRTGRTMQRCCEAIWKRKMKLLRLRTLVDPADNKRK